MASVEIESQPWALTLREVPWMGKDLAIGFAPVVLGLATSYLLGRSIERSLPHWLWIPASFALLAWMFAFPLWVAGRRLGIPSIPKPHRVLIEALIAAPAAIFVFATLSVVTTFLSQFMNQGTLVSPILLHSLNNGMWMGILLYTLAVAANAPVLGIRGDPHDKSCLLTEVVPGGAAEEAGLRAGDVIVAAGENSVKNLYDIVLIMRMKKIGDKIPVWFIRDGKRFQVEAVLKSRPK